MSTELIINLKNMAYSITIASLLVIFAISFSNKYNENSLVALIISYSAILCGLIFTIGIVFTMLQIPVMSKLYSLLPFIIISAVILVFLILLVTYFDNIVANKVPNSYYLLSLISTIFIATQLIVLYNSVSNMELTGYKLMSNKILTILTFLGTINFLIVSILGIMLKFFITDG